MKPFLLSIACLSFSMLPALQATALNIINPSFEIDILGNGGNGYTVNGWTPNVGCCGVGIQDPTVGMYTSGLSFDGNNFAYGNGGGYGYYQVLTDVFKPNTTYVFSMMVGHRKDLGFGGYKLELRAGNTFSFLPVVASVSGASDPGSGLWAPQSVTYTTGASGTEIGQNILISFGSNGVQTNFDMATGTASTVPEPATLGLIGASLIGLGIRSRRLLREVRS